MLLFAFALAAFALWVIRKHRQRAPWASRAIAIVPALAWTVAWAAMTRAVLAAHFGATTTDVLWEGPRAKLAEFARAFGVASTPGLVEWTVLAAIAVYAGFALWREGKRPRRSVAISWTRSVAALALAAYVLLPYSVYDPDRVTYGLFVLYPRFAVLSLIFLVVTLDAPPSRRARRATAVLMATASIALALNWWFVLDHAGDEARGLDGALASLPPNRILKSLIATPSPDGLRYEGFLHVASYYQGRNLGETDQSFAALLSSPIHYRDPERRPYLSLHDEHLHPERFDSEQARLYDYILSYRRTTPASADSTWTIYAGGR